MKQIAVTGSFDDLRSRQIRFLEEAARLGEVNVLLWSDEAIHAHTGKEPKFPLAERLYFVQAIRYVSRVTPISGLIAPNALPQVTDFRPDIWAVDENSFTPAIAEWCATAGVACHVINNNALRGFPLVNTAASASSREKVIVTGCYDWLHSGHIRFFEEVSGLGDLYVAVGNDANVTLLKGLGHPLFSQDERRYMVQAIRYVHTALMTSGMGWMDAEPEIAWLKPEMYAVNEDGDKPEKREFCASHGLLYVVFKRAPKEGLPRRESTKLRGF